MRVSQLLHVMDKNDCIEVMLDGAPVDRQCLYCGIARGIHKDDPINRGHITMLCACDDWVIVEIKLAEGKVHS